MIRIFLNHNDGMVVVRYGPTHSIWFVPGTIEMFEDLLQA